MNHPDRTILDLVGNTTLLALRRIAPANGARILLKLESENPTGSMKDRMALAMVEAAEADGRLKPGGSVVEYTGGSTGVSLSLVCAVKGYPLHIVTSDAFAREKLEHMKLLGAQLQIADGSGAASVCADCSAEEFSACRGRAAGRPGLGGGALGKDGAACLASGLALEGRAAQGDRSLAQVGP